MQNTFSQSGNDSKWFLKKIIFQNRYVELETPLHGENHPKFPFLLFAYLPYTAYIAFTAYTAYTASEKKGEDNMDWSGVGNPKILA